MMSGGSPRVSNRLAIKRKIKEEKGSDDEDSDFINPFKIRTGTSTTGKEVSSERDLQPLIKRGRGRPPKTETSYISSADKESDDYLDLEDEPDTPKVKIVTVVSSSMLNKRGRPRKHPKPFQTPLALPPGSPVGPVVPQVTTVVPPVTTVVPQVTTAVPQDTTAVPQVTTVVVPQVTTDHATTTAATPVGSAVMEYVVTASSEAVLQSEVLSTHGAFSLSPDQTVQTISDQHDNQAIIPDSNTNFEVNMSKSEVVEEPVNNETEPMAVTEILPQEISQESTNKQVTLNVPGGAKVYFATAKTLQESTAQFLIQRLSEKAEHTPTSEIFPLVAASVSDHLLEAIPGSQENTIKSIFADNGVSLQEKEGLKFASGSLENLIKAKMTYKKMQAQDQGKAAQDVSQELEQDVAVIASESEEENETFQDDSDPDYKPGSQDSFGVILVKAKQQKKGYKKCDLCSYKSSADGVKRHKLRVHPDSLTQCEICGMPFGVLYDMRRHRLTHFDSRGNLTTKGKEILMKYDPSRGELCLGDLEESFEPVQDLIEQVAEKKELKQESVDGKAIAVPDTTHEAPGQDETVNDTDTPAEGTPAVAVEASEPTPEKTATSNLNVTVAKNTRVTCGLCQQELTLTALRLHHNAHPNAIYKCPNVECEEENSDIASLENHYNTKHNTEESPVVLDGKVLLARCNECEFSGVGSWVIQHTIENHPMKLCCTKCQATYNSDVEFRLHYLSSHTEKGVTSDSVKLRLPPRTVKGKGKLECSKCERTFNHLQNYKKHLSTHCKNIYKCELCPYQSEKLGIVNHHIRQQHASLEDTTCRHCNKVFSTPATLQYHVQTIHQHAKYCCDECGKNFTSKKYLQVHISRIHRKRLNHFCEVCGKGFYEKMRRDEHQHTHADASEKEAKKIYTCSYCGNRYARRFQLLQHENTHTGHRPYKCKLCGKGFPYASEVSKHMIAHRDDRPFPCTVCGKAFKFSYKLRSHMVIHTKQGRHSCQDCGKVFTALATLRKHACKSAPSVSGGEHKVVFSMAHPQQARFLQELIVKHKSIVNAEDTDIVDGSLHVITPRDEEGSLIERIVQAASQTEQGASFCDVQYTTEPSDTLVYLTNTEDEGEKEGQEGEEQAVEEDSRVLYMCGICNSIFPSGEEVGVHMSEHGVSMVVEEEGGTEEGDYDNKEGIEIINQEQEEVILSEMPGVHEVVALGGVEGMQEVVSSSQIIQFEERQAANTHEIVVHSEDVEAAANALTNLLG